MENSIKILIKIANKLEKEKQFKEMILIDDIIENIRVSMMTPVPSKQPQIQQLEPTIRKKKKIIKKKKAKQPIVKLEE